MFRFRKILTLSTVDIENMAIFADYSRPTSNCRCIMISMPFFSVVLTSLAFSVSYIMKVKVGDIKAEPYIPHLSEVGQSSMFTLGLSLSAILNLVILVIRFYQVKEIPDRAVKVNHFSLSIGFIFILGKMITAVYWLSVNTIVHYTGCGLYFIGFFFYIVTQVYITRNYIPHTNNCIAFLRTACCVVFLTGLLAFIVLMTPFFSEFNQSYNYIAPICEWTVVITKAVFILTLAYDFWTLGLNIEVRKFNNDHDRFSSASSKRELRGRYSVNSSHKADTENYDSVYFEERLPAIPNTLPHAISKTF